MSHWVTTVVDGSDTQIIDVTHSFDEAVEAGRKNVTMYYDNDEDPERLADIEAYNASLAEALAEPHANQSDVQFECGSASYDIWITKVGGE